MGARITLLYGDEWPAVKVKVLASRHETLLPNDELLPRLAQFLSN
jgi:hypothetical protein